jgi:hypothetical protein
MNRRGFFIEAVRVAETWLPTIISQSTESHRIANQIEAAFIFARAWAGRLEATPRLIVKGKRISCPPHHDYEHGFPLIRSLRASAQRSTSVLFSFVLSLLIVAESFAVRQSKTILARS